MPESLRPLLICLALALWACGPMDTLKRRLEAGDDGLLFSHPAHVARGVGCTDCHQLDQGAARYAIPGHDTCSACHQTEPTQGLNSQGDTSRGCAQCHARIPAADAQRAGPPARYRMGALTFRHGDHAQEGCVACHGALAKTQPRFAEPLPAMATCVSCHAQRGAPNDCATCHPALPAPWADPEVLATLPFPHPEGWERLHGPLAQANAESCALCHQPSTCQTCHLTTPPQDHRAAGWPAVTHGKEALFDRARCASCHVETSCQRCHQLAPTTHTASFQDPLSAPAGDAGVRLHSLLGKSQLRTCLTCHATSDCTPCHTGGSL